MPGNQIGSSAQNQGGQEAEHRLLLAAPRGRTLLGACTVLALFVVAWLLFGTIEVSIEVPGVLMRLMCPVCG